jgi:hypothetical protein
MPACTGKKGELVKEKGEVGGVRGQLRYEFRNYALHIVISKHDGLW